MPHRNLVPHQILALERLLFQKFDLAEVFVLEVLRLRAEVLIVLQAFGDVSVIYRRLPDVHVEQSFVYISNFVAGVA